MYYWPMSARCLHHGTHTWSDGWCNAHTLRPDLAGVSGLSGEKSERLTLRNRIVEMYRGGKNTAQTAEVLGIPERAVEGHLRQAKVLEERVGNQTEVPPSREIATQPPDGQHVAQPPRPRTMPKGLRTEHVAAAIQSGMTIIEAARQFGVSDTTIRWHLRKMKAPAEVMRLNLPAPAALVAEVLRAVAGMMPGARVEYRGGELVVVERRGAEAEEREAKAA